MVLHVLQGNHGCGSALCMPQECSGVLFGKFDSLRQTSWPERVVWGVWNAVGKGWEWGWQWDTSRAGHCQGSAAGNRAQGARAGPGSSCLGFCHPSPAQSGLEISIKTHLKGQQAEGFAFF